MNNDKIQCLICKGWFATIASSHLRCKHDMTVEEYRRRYKNAAVVSKSYVKSFNGNGGGISSFKAKATEEEWKAYRAKLREGQRRRFKDPAQCKGISDRAIERYKDPSERKKLSDAAKARFEDPAVRERFREIGRARFEKMSQEELQAFISAPLKGGPTSGPEKRLVKKLKKLGLRVKAGHKLGRFLVDAFLPDEGIAVELYGDYWHTNPERFAADYVHPTIGLTAEEIWKRDRKRVRKIEKLGCRVVVVWEREMKFLSSSDLKKRLYGNTEPSSGRKV